MRGTAAHTTRVIHRLQHHVGHLFPYRGIQCPTRVATRLPAVALGTNETRVLHVANRILDEVIKRLVSVVDLSAEEPLVTQVLLRRKRRVFSRMMIEH